jgi:hypothetical protein
MQLQARQTRQVLMAMLFGPPRFVTREEASAIHGAICDALAQDDLSFQYSGVGNDRQSRGFSLAIGRSEGKGGFGVILDMASMHHPVRLLTDYSWPASIEHVKEGAAIVHKAVFERLAGPIHRVLAEVRIRAQCGIPGGNALAFMRDRAVGNGVWLRQVEQPLQQVTLHVEFAPGAHDEPLDNPKRDLTVEVLREEPASLYIEAVSVWPQLPDQPSGHVDPSALRQILEDPAQYIEDSFRFLDDVLPLIGNTSKG